MSKSAAFIYPLLLFYYSSGERPFLLTDQVYCVLMKDLLPRQTGGRSPRRVEDHLPEPSDNVWFTKYYKWKVSSRCLFRNTVKLCTFNEIQLCLRY